MTVLSIILGVFLTAGGIQCMFSPLIATTGISLIVPIFIGVTLIVNSITKFIMCSELRKAGVPVATKIAVGIITLILGLLLLFSGVVQGTFSAFIMGLIPVLLSCMLIAFGILRIVNAFSVKNGKVGSNVAWGWHLALGAFFVLVGVASLIDPLTSLVAIGIVIGVNITLCGLSLIFDSFNA